MNAPVSPSRSTGIPLPGATNPLREKAKELEGVFLNTLMKQMFSSIKTDGPFGGGYAEETWRSMQSEQYAASMAEAGGIGLADQIMRDLLQIQQAAQTNPSLTTGSQKP